MNSICPICSSSTNTSGRYCNFICGECIHKYPQESLCGRPIQFGNVSFSGGFVSIIDGEKTNPPQHFFELVMPDGRRILGYAEEHRFGGIVFNVATRTKEEAIRIMAENTERKKAMESVINDEQQGARELREWRLNHDPVCHARLVKAKDFLENGHASLATAPVCTSKINDEINETKT